MEILEVEYGLKAYVVTECSDCLVGLTGIPEEPGKQGGWAGTIYLNELSGHSRDYELSWRGRLRYAWLALRGHPVTSVSLDSPVTVERLKTVLDAMAFRVWPAGSMWRKEG